MARAVDQMSSGDYLARIAECYPDRIAVVAGTRRLTFRSLNDRSNRLANALRARGIGPGDKVASLFFNGAEAIETYYGVVKTGAAIVPLNFRLAPTELRGIVDDSDARAFFFSPEFAELVETIRPELPKVEHYLSTGAARLAGTLDAEALIASASAEEPEIDIPPDDPCEILYTGGTTGLPKGAVRTHHNVSYAIHCCSAALEMRPGDRYLATAPMFHLAGLECSCLPMLAIGGTVVTLKAFEPLAVLEAIAAERITHAIFVPAMFIALIKTPEVWSADLSSLRLWMSGTAPLPVQINRTLLDRFPAIRLREGYGSTEAQMISSLSPDDQRRKEACVGLPILTQQVRIVDDEGRSVPCGEVGEIVCRSPMVISQYYKREEETRRAVRNGWFHTGDMGRFDEEGYLYIVDRKKDMIISGGENVFAVEVENVLYDHPAVAEAAVIGLPHPKWGEVVTAVIVPKRDAAPTDQEIMAFCQGKVAAYKRPRLVKFVAELPRSSLGKVQKAALREMFGGTSASVDYYYRDELPT